MGEPPDCTICHLASPASSLTDYRYVGNKMAAFVMQSMGCDVATLNTVQFSMQTEAINPRSISIGLLPATPFLLNKYQATTLVTSSS